MNTKWISTRDKLPSTDETVLVCVRGLVGIGGYSAQYGWWLTGADFCDKPVDYWMSLPKAPNYNNPDVDLYYVDERLGEE